MARYGIGSAGAYLLGLGFMTLLSCVYIPPEESPPDVSRQATATVGNAGRMIVGEALMLEIPEGAVESDEAITVTIDRVVGAPDGHLGVAYMVEPADHVFLKPVVVRYRYDAADVAGVSAPDALFVGKADGAGWSRLSEGETDLDARTIQGQTSEMGVIGLVDPNWQG